MLPLLVRRSDRRANSSSIPTRNYEVAICVYDIRHLNIVCSPAPSLHESSRESFKEEIEESLSEILSIALKDPSYMMIFVGFFSADISLHSSQLTLTLLITEMSAPIDPTGWCGDLGIETTVTLGGFAISVIGVMNIVGTLA